MKLYISRLRQPDGSWVVDPEPRTLRETKKHATFNRVMGGVTTQIWPLEEAKKVFCRGTQRIRSTIMTQLAPVANQHAAVSLIREASELRPNEAGMWRDVPMATYHALPGESNSSLALLARSPKRYKLIQDGLMSRPPSTHDQEIGTMIHSVVNEGMEPPFYLRPDTYPGKDKEGNPVDKPWTLQANYCKAWEAERTDRPILTSYEALMINAVTSEVLNNWRAMKLLSNAWREISACARNHNLDLPYLLRCRFDILGRDEQGWYWVETKSTRDASTEAFSREIYKRGYHVQCAIYRRILRRLTGEDSVRCYMMPIEKDAAVPRVNVRQLQPGAMDIGDKVLDERLKLLKRCRLSNSWPALPDDIEEESAIIPFIDLPDHAYFDDEEEEISASAEVLR